MSCGRLAIGVFVVLLLAQWFWQWWSNRQWLKELERRRAQKRNGRNR